MASGLGNAKSRLFGNRLRRRTGGDDDGDGGRSSMTGSTSPPRNRPFSGPRHRAGSAISSIMNYAGMGGGGDAGAPGLYTSRSQMTLVSLPCAFQGNDKLNAADLETAVTMETPEHRWWTPQRGWPEGCALRGVEPEPVTVSTEEAPYLYPREEDILGEVRVEILEAAGLPCTDTFSLTDAYGIVVCEAFAGRTNVIKDSISPVWLPNMPRAFKFPVTRPFSDVYVALLDEEVGATSAIPGAHGTLDSDDPLGRVVIQLRGLHPRTEYTAWFPLQRETLKRHVGRYGSVRIRYSVTWKDDRCVLTNYFTGKENAFVLPFTDFKYKYASAFAISGEMPEDVYNYGVLKEHLAEVSAHLGSFGKTVDCIMRILYWKHPRLSIMLSCLWQFLCTHPRFLVACGPLSIVALLNWTYEEGPCSKPEPVCRSPSFADYLRCLVMPKTMGGALPPLQAEPVYRHQQAVELAYHSEDEDDKNIKIPGKKTKEERLREKQEKQEAQEQEKLTDGRSRVQKLGMALNPMALVLFPIQRLLASVVQPLRLIKHIFSWQDAALTTDIYVTLCLLSLILAVLPWHFIFMWTFRILGVVLLGPHMYFVGLMSEKAERENRHKTEEQIEAEVKAAEEAKAKAKAEARAKRSKRYERRRSHYLNAPYRHQTDSSPFTVEKYKDVLDARRATARPLIDKVEAKVRRNANIVMKKHA